eukprot:Hpha_TRINITY_DN13470_c0_g1::TRINITY_DN13470_c0_g1_i3::g.131148::m.131148
MGSCHPEPVVVDCEQSLAIGVDRQTLTEYLIHRLPCPCCQMTVYYACNSCCIDDPYTEQRNSLLKKFQSKINHTLVKLRNELQGTNSPVGSAQPYHQNDQQRNEPVSTSMK